MSQGSVLGTLFFLSFINYLPLGLTTNVKLFTDEISHFLFRDQAFNWKMSFNPDPTKQMEEINFSATIKKILGTHSSSKTSWFNVRP